MKPVFRILTGAAIAAPICVVAFAMIFGNRAVFMPAALDDSGNARRTLSPTKIEDVEILSEGLKLSGWWMNPPEAKSVLLFFHGNAGNVSNRIGYLLALQKIPVAVLLLDYRGYGKSEGSPSESGVYQDAQAAYQWLRNQKWEPRQIFLYGESLGGAVAIELAQHAEIAGLIVQTTFTSIGDMALQVIPLIPLGWAISAKFKSIEKIGAIRVPKLHFHGVPDEVVPFKQGKQLFEAAAEPKRWVEYPDMSHNVWPGARERDWLAELQRFLAENSR